MITPMEMRAANPPTTESAIQRFEKERGLRLPPSFRRFLLATNGGYPLKNTYPLPVRPSDPHELVQNFLGLGLSTPTSNLDNAYDFYAGRIPFGIVLIANQDFGSYICLDLRGGRERVVFWDQRHFWGTGEWREEDLYHVAATFDEFLTLLEPNPY